MRSLRRLAEVQHAMKKTRPARSAKPAPFPRIVGDVGGTHSRFAWVQEPDAPLTNFADYTNADHAGLGDVMAKYLADEARPAPVACAIGVASPIDGGKVEMTNSQWSFTPAHLQRRFGLERFQVLNDFEALARGLPTLKADELMQVGGNAAGLEGGALALLGPGTGLGMSGLLRTAQGPVPVVGEGGHTTLAAGDVEEDAILAALRRTLGHVSAERVLSGEGLVNLYRAICAVAGRPAADHTPADITSRVDVDIDCRRAVDRFFAFLGSVAGDLALTLGARGGVYIAGGIVPRLGDAIRNSAFRARFEAKGRFSAYLAPIPAWVILDATWTALRGANLALDGPCTAP